MKERILSVLLSLLLALFALSASVAVPVLWRGFYYLHIDALSLPETTGYSETVIREAFDAMMDFELKGAPFSTGQLQWSEDGMQHFADVRVLFHLDLWVLGITALLLLYFLFRKKLRPHHFRGFSPSFYAGAGTLVFFACITALAALDFDRAFTVFHRIFFPGKTNWIFDWQADEIIRILPQTYFRNCAILIVSLIFLFCAAYILCGIHRHKQAETVGDETEMPLLFTVDLKDYNPEGKRYYRPSARAIIRRGEEVALIYSRKNDYYKIPGGGIDPGEDRHTALIRETREEAGLSVIPESIRPFGRVTRIQKGTEAEDEVFVQENFYFTCEVEEGSVPPALTEKEQAQDFVPAFATPAHAAEVNRTHPHGPDAKPAMLERETRVLELIS